jgi:hypothetical protein
MTDTTGAAVAEQVTEATAAEAGTTESTPASAGETMLTGKADTGNQEGVTAAEDQKAEDKPAEGSEGKADVPEAYEFKFPEGVEVDPDTVGELGNVAKELGLTQEQAQRIADLGAKQSERWVEAQKQIMEATEKQWVDEVRSDKEFGGDKLDENLAVAVKALDKFGSPELTQFLKESRLGNHPEMFRLAVRIGKAIADDSVVPGGRSTNQASDPAALFYPNSKHT